VLYDIEDEIREKKLSGEAKRMHRLTHSKPRVEIFFDWIERKFEQHGLKPPTAFTKALQYARSRRVGLEVFLGDTDVAMDTNHLERALRAIPMGRNYPRLAIMHGSQRAPVKFRRRRHCVSVAAHGAASAL
jgi:hypothetical protein